MARFSISRLLPLLSLLLSTAAAQGSISFTSLGNPILGDGSYYSADPAPIVVNNTLYILAGQDSSRPENAGFTINNWLLFQTNNPNPAGAQWTMNPSFMRPESVYKWAAAGSAFASQIVRGPDGRFYAYSPVAQARSNTQDAFGIGVSVASSIQGPYVDHNPSGPIVSQAFPTPNNIHNIDPTVVVDDDGKVFMYWGSFGQLRGVQLQSDMKTFASSVVEVRSLNGFFEAPWFMKRNGVYYMLYAANNAGADSPCTPTVYHACLAYGTATSPLGPWTFRGVFLGIVSSTTSHPGAVQMDGQWYLVYHTADAKDGGHFRRSIAFDKMDFDDTKSPPAIRTVQQTRRAPPPKVPTRNRAQLAKASSNPPAPLVYWAKSLNDEIIRVAPLPPDYWCSYNGEQSPVKNVLSLAWDTPQKLNGTSMAFFADQGAGSVIGVAPPVSWFVEYLAADGSWVRVRNQIAYPLTVTKTPREVPFDQIETRGLRATLQSSTNGQSTAGVGVHEWYAFSPTSAIV